jgi:hypothetical protein
LTAIVVSLVLAAAWLTAAVSLTVWFAGRAELVPVAWVAYLMAGFNLVKAWAQNRARKRRAAADRPYRAGDAPPVRRAP